jgi:hypothetical protein
MAVGALMGAAYGSAGERCMAISVAVPVGEETANRLIEKLVPKIEALKIGPAADRASEMGPLVTAQHLAKVKGYVDAGEKEGRRSSSTAGASRRRRATGHPVVGHRVLVGLGLKSANSTLAAHPDGHLAYTGFSTNSVDANSLHPPRSPGDLEYSNVSRVL